MSGEQFAPITKPYLKQWQERLEADRLIKAIKTAKARSRKKSKKVRK